MIVKMMLGLKELSPDSHFAYFTPLNCVVTVQKHFTTGKSKILFHDEAQTSRSVNTRQLMALRLVIGQNPFRKESTKFEIPVEIDRPLHRVERKVYSVDVTEECQNTEFHYKLSAILSSGD